MKMYKKEDFNSYGWRGRERCANRIVLVVAVAMESPEFTAVR